MSIEKVQVARLSIALQVPPRQQLAAPSHYTLGTQVFAIPADINVDAAAPPPFDVIRILPSIASSAPQKMTTQVLRTSAVNLPVHGAARNAHKSSDRAVRQHFLPFAGN